MGDFIARYRKAVTGAVLAGGAALAVALQDGSIDAGEVITIVVAVLASGGGVAAIGNKRGTPESPVRDGNGYLQGG